MSDLAAALQVAIKVHARQVDRQGEPYLLHVLRVVQAVSDEAKVVAALHDVVEDGGGYRALLGLDLSVTEASSIRLLTRSEYQTYETYIEKLRVGAEARIAREVKLADLRDNLSRIPGRPSSLSSKLRAQVEWDAEWGGLKRRYEKAITTLEAAS